MMTASADAYRATCGATMLFSILTRLKICEMIIQDFPWLSQKGTQQYVPPAFFSIFFSRCSGSCNDNCWSGFVDELALSFIIYWSKFSSKIKRDLPVSRWLIGILPCHQEHKKSREIAQLSARAISIGSIECASRAMI